MYCQVKKEGKKLIASMISALWSMYICARVCVCVFSCVWLFMTPWTVACQGPLSMGFSRQEYWRGLPFPSSGESYQPKFESASFASPALQVESLPMSHQGKAINLLYSNIRPKKKYSGKHERPEGKNILRRRPEKKSNLSDKTELSCSLQAVEQNL